MRELKYFIRFKAFPAYFKEFCIKIEHDNEVLPLHQEATLTQLGFNRRGSVHEGALFSLSQRYFWRDFYFAFYPSFDYEYSV